MKNYARFSGIVFGAVMLLLALAITAETVLRKLFSFSLAPQSTQMLDAVTGRWALYCMDKPLRSLDFLNTVLD